MGQSPEITGEFAAGVSAVLEAVKAGRIPMAQFEIAAERILQWKYSPGLFTRTST